MLCESIGSTEAAEQLFSVQATALGAALALNGKDSKVRSSVRRLSRAAYPEVRDDGA